MHVQQTAAAAAAITQVEVDRLHSDMLWNPSFPKRREAEDLRCATQEKQAHGHASFRLGLKDKFIRASDTYRHRHHASPSGEAKVDWLLSLSGLPKHRQTSAPVNS
jgi:hypothetical protein